ncbi:hypothetical protein TNCT_79081 [Trichonephila clavata]|uniref:Uncharacterized protein n=1 Tax=Trichonephila clavata TaxID=2740835 RepID=A0A8X6KAE7_TRICU|nr:hypothetical protein TNCT_79081 [Trichonephila clavata]
MPKNVAVHYHQIVRGICVVKRAGRSTQGPSVKSKRWVGGPFVPPTHGRCRALEGFRRALSTHRPCVLKQAGRSTQGPSDKSKRWVGGPFVPLSHGRRRYVEGFGRALSTHRPCVVKPTGRSTKGPSV